MLHPRFALLCLIALATTSAAATPPAVAARPVLPQTLVFDATFTHVRSAGPDIRHVGHRQIVTGSLRTVAGHAAGRFSFTCTWTRLEPDGAVESCHGSAWTDDGQLDAAGPGQTNSVTHEWKVTGGTGAYRGTQGTVTVRDLSDRESLISAAVTTPERAVLHAGKVSRPSANNGFIVRAQDLCGTAARRLAALPAFPFKAFNPVDPDPSLLPAVGAFFTGPGDPRPILRALNVALHGLGQPPGNRGAWGAAVRARQLELAVMNEQDRAALVSDVHSFVKSVRASAANFRDVAITATVFGVSACVI